MSGPGWRLAKFALQCVLSLSRKRKTSLSRYKYPAQSRGVFEGSSLFIPSTWFCMYRYFLSSPSSSLSQLARQWNGGIRVSIRRDGRTTHLTWSQPRMANSSSMACESVKHSNVCMQSYTFWRRPYYFYGTNAYWLQMTSDADMDRTFHDIATAGFQVVRTWAFNDVSKKPPSGTYFQVRFHYIYRTWSHCWW